MTEAENQVIWHQHSNRLLEKMIDVFPKYTTIIDLGCGHNFYASALDFLGYDTLGIDIVPMSNVDLVQDITKLDIEVPDNVNIISLEVGEYIPKEKEADYLNSLCSFEGSVLLSWAAPNQFGIGHINCRPNNYIIKQMEERGKRHNDKLTKDFRAAVKDCHCDWFKETLMYFEQA